MKKFHKVNKEAERFSPSIEEGLNEEIVNQRKLDGFVNVAKNPTNKSYFQIIIESASYFIHLF